MSNKLQFSKIVAGVMNWGEWGYNLNPPQVRMLMEQCLEVGVTTFDHADIYGDYTTEYLFGMATGGSSSLRQKMQLISKCGIKLVTPNRPKYRIKSYDTSKAHILQSAEQSLRNLKTDYLDLLLIHRPSPLMSPEEIASAFQELLDAGKVKNVGVSNFTPSQFATLNQLIPLACNQIELSLLQLIPFLDGTLEQLMASGSVPMAYSPMARGAFFTNSPNEAVQRIRFLSGRLEQKYQTTLDKIVLAFLLKHPSGILPVLGTVRIERIKAALEAIEIQLTDEEWFMLWEASMGEEVP
ncbi:MAG: aldo/keto reductase [Bacteroidota bacterium]